MARKPKVPKEYQDIWNKDYYELTSEQRRDLTEFYIRHLQAYEAMGGAIKKLDPPLFSTQTEILLKEEEVRMDPNIALEKQRRDEEEARQREQRKLEWESKRILKLDEMERLQLENFQLKLELAERTITDANKKKNEFIEAQALLAVAIEKRLGITLDDYKIDLISGYIGRSPGVVYIEQPIEKK